MVFASSTRAAENKSRWKGIVSNSSVVPRRPSKITSHLKSPKNQILNEISSSMKISQRISKLLRGQDFQTEIVQGE